MIASRAILVSTLAPLKRPSDMFCVAAEMKSFERFNSVIALSVGALFSALPWTAVSPAVDWPGGKV